MVPKSTVWVPGLGYHADGPGGRTDITELIVDSIKSAARQAQPCRRTYPAGKKGRQPHRQRERDGRSESQSLGSPVSLAFHAGRTGGCTDWGRSWIVNSIKSAARQAQPCSGALSAGDKGR